MLPKIASIPYAERFAGRKPRIFIGLVAYGDISPEIMLSWAIWCVGLGKRYADRFEIYFGMATKREQYRARNFLVEQAQGMGADFLLMVDDDHTVHDCPDMLERFFELEKPIQTALSFKRTRDGLEPTVLRVDDVGRCDFLRMNELPKEPAPVDASGGGCTWVDMWVFDFLAQPFWFPFPEATQKVTFIPNPTWGLDIHFCIRAKQLLGVETWLNTNITLGHMVNEREIVRPNPSGMTGEDFAHRERWRGAYSQVADVLCSAFEFETVVDVGSAQGFLVDEFLSRGKDVRGVESQFEALGYMSDGARAVIKIADATRPDSIRGTYDLVTCIEVAEHIKPEGSVSLVENLIRAAKGYIYFTADETPGHLHINARKHDYWLALFRERGWVVDEDKTAEIRRGLYGCPCEWLVQNSFVLRKES